MAASIKIRKLDIESSPKSPLSDQTISELSTAFDNLCSTELANNVTLMPYKIKNSNAADRHKGVAFSKAYCDLESYEKGFILGDIFRRGLEIGIDYLDGEFPDAKHEKIVLDQLIKYLKHEADNKFNLDCMSETELTKVLANHLFGKLSTSDYYTIDKECKGKGKGINMKKCSCCKDTCKLTGRFGDTSIGNSQVWHGSVDIIVENSLIIDTLEDEPDSPGGKSPVEVKVKSAYLSRNPQLVAETIVFSFLQKKRHPERGNFLTPCIGVGSTFMLLMLYDSLHDVLLESSPVPLTSSSSGKFRIEAILLAWLAVNYKFLCTGLTDEMVSYKSSFFEQAKEKLEVYENELMSENIETGMTEDFAFPKEWSYNAFLLEKHNKIEELRRKRALRFFKEDEKK